MMCSTSGHMSDAHRRLGERSAAIALLLAAIAASALAATAPIARASTEARARPRARSVR